MYTDKELRTERYLRKMTRKGQEKSVRVLTDRPPSAHTQAQASFIINDSNRTCPDCKAFVNPKKARRRFREMFRVAESKGKRLVLDEMDGFNGKCNCGAFLLCEGGQ